MVLDLVCIYIFSFFHFFFFSFIIILLLSTFLLFTFSLSLSFFPSCLLRRFLFFYSYITGSGNNAHLFRCYLPICQKFKKFKKKIKTQNLIVCHSHNFTDFIKIKNSIMVAMVNSNCS